MPLKDLGTLRPETDEQRREKAIVGPADVAELKVRMEAHSQVGEVLNEAGQIHTTSADETRAMIFAENHSSGVVGAFEDWIEGQLQQ